MTIHPPKDRHATPAPDEPAPRPGEVAWHSEAREPAHAAPAAPATHTVHEEELGTEQRAPTGTRAAAKTIDANLRSSADEEMKRPAGQLAWSALAAGLLIGFGFLASAFLTQLGVRSEARHALAAAGYPLGFIFVVFGRSMLFTEQTLEPVLPVLHDRKASTLWRLLRLWAIVLPLNLIGALAFAWMVARTPLLPPSLHEALTEVARHSTVGGFAKITYEAVFGGWLVALMAWLVASTRTTGAQLAFVWLATAPISALGFAHSIAGAVEAFYRAFAGDATWLAMVGDFVVPAVIGNVIGGVLLVAMLNHGQVASRKGETHH